MVKIERSELELLITWALDSLFENQASQIDTEIDFYWRPDETSELFGSDPPRQLESVGSIKDELELMRSSVVNGDGIDIPDIVLERLGYLFLALSKEALDRTA
jgi:hypothetical protein